MEKEKFVLNTIADPEIIRLFKTSLSYQNITISDWAEKKITEEAKTIEVKNV